MKRFSEVKIPLKSIEDVAEELNLSSKTIRTLIKAGELKASKIGGQWRIKPEEVKILIDKTSN